MSSLLTLGQSMPWMQLPAPTTPSAASAFITPTKPARGKTKSKAKPNPSPSASTEVGFAMGPAAIAVGGSSATEMERALRLHLPFLVENLRSLLALDPIINQEKVCGSGRVWLFAVVVLVSCAPDLMCG
jgi:hypothetical protein